MLVALVVLAGAAFVCRDAIVDEWQIRQLRSDESETRRAAALTLGERRSERAVPALIDLLRGDPSARDAAQEALVAIFPHASPERAREVVAAFLGVLRQDDELRRLADVIERPWADSSNVQLARAVRGLGSTRDAVLPLFADELSRKESRLFGIAARTLVDGWPRSQSAIERFLSAESASSAVRFFEAIGLRWEVDFFLAGEWRFGPSTDPPPCEHSGAVARYFARNGGNPALRAVALSFALFGSVKNEVDFAPLAAALATDGDRDVRIAAIRMVGFLGPHNESAPSESIGVDLTKLLVEKSDVVPLHELIEARDVWSRYPPYAIGVDLGFDVQCDWLPGAERIALRPWALEELRRLEEVLATSDDVRARDAASAALAGRHRDAGKPSSLPPPDFEVHEWGVWRDGGDHLAVALDATGELPDFVHRLTAATRRMRKDAAAYAAEYENYRDPAIWFYADRPVSIRFQVRFFEGSPWGVYPRLTDYVLGGGQLVARPGEPSCASSPPERSTVTVRSVAPWLVPDLPQVSAEAWRHLGVEWNGLRIGYDAALEAPLSAVDDVYWWRALRSVAASPVSIRGETEGFLFYGGAVKVPSPVVVEWTDATESALSIRVRSYGEYPTVADWGERYRARRESRWSRDPRPRWDPVPWVFVICVDADGTLRGALLDRLGPAESSREVALGALSLDRAALVESFVTRLGRRGLTPAETRAFVEVWSSELFETPGLRTLAILPRWILDLAMPWRIEPSPKRSVRVACVWKECDELAVRASANMHRRRLVNAARLGVSRQYNTITPHVGPYRPGPTSEVWTSRARRLVGIDVPCERAEISGDGRFVAVQTRYGIDHAVFRVDLVTGRAVRLAVWKAKLRGRGCSVSISEDGARIGISGPFGDGWRNLVIEAAEGRMIELLDLSGSWTGHIVADGKRLISSGGDVIDLATGERVDWSCGGSRGVAASAAAERIVVTGRNGVHLVDTAAQTLRELCGSKGDPDHPTISRDGSVAAWETSIDRDREIYLADLDAQTIENLSRHPGYDAAPHLSGDGRLVAFVRDGRLRVLDRVTGRMVGLDEPREVKEPRLSGDGRRVIWLAPGPRGKQRLFTALVEELDETVDP